MAKYLSEEDLADFHGSPSAFVRLAQPPLCAGRWKLLATEAVRQQLTTEFAGELNGLRQAALISTTFLISQSFLMSRIGGWPKKRLYSRLNWLTLSYPTSNATVEASRPSTSIRPRAACNRNCF